MFMGTPTGMEFKPYGTAAHYDNERERELDRDFSDKGERDRDRDRDTLGDREVPLGAGDTGLVLFTLSDMESIKLLSSSALSIVLVFELSSNKGLLTLLTTEVLLLPIADEVSLSAATICAPALLSRLLSRAIWAR